MENNMDKIIVTTQLTLKEYLKVNYYLLFKKWSMWLLPFVGLLSIFFYILGYADISALYFGVIFIIFFPALTYYLFRRNYFNDSRITETITYTFDNEIVESKGESFDSSFTWDKVYMVAETKSWILLYPSRYIAYVIPKSKISKEDLNILKSIIESHKKIKNKLK